MYKITDIHNLVGCLDITKPLFLDTETAQYNKDIRLIQMYQEGWDKALLLDTKGVSSSYITQVWEVIKKYHLVGHNLLYDLQCFKADSVIEFELPAKWDDTFYLSRIAFPEWQEYALDKCLTKVLGYDPYAKMGLNKKTMQESYGRLAVKGEYISGAEGLRDLTSSQYLYGAIDVVELPHLYNACKFIEEEFVYKLDIVTAEHCIKMGEWGMPVDFDILNEMEQSKRLEMSEITKQLPIGFNPNSYKQVRELLGLKYTSDEEVLAIIESRPGGIKGLTLTDSKKNEVIETDFVINEKVLRYTKLIRRYKKLSKQLSFVERARKFSQNTGRIKSHFSPHAITGRVQGQDENLSQYPRSMKKMWGVKPDSGRVLIYSDYSQLELRSICAILPERNMERAYRNKVDLHTYASENMNLDVSKLPEGVAPRFVSKQLNFLALYGGGKQNFQRTVCKLTNVWLPDDVVEEGFNKWKKTFSDIDDWHKRNAKSKTQMDVTISGRPYKAQKYTDLNNIKNQGSGAEVAKLAIHYLYKHSIMREVDSNIVNFIHDAVIIDSPNDSEVYTKLSKELAICFQAAWFDIMTEAPIPDLPMPVDVAVNYNWGVIEENDGEGDIFNYTLDDMFCYGKTIEEALNECRSI